MKRRCGDERFVMFKRNSKFSPTQLQFFIISALLLGIFFRCTDIHRKIYWHDEAFTSLRVSGYTMAEVVQEVKEAEEVGIKYLQKYQQLKPASNITDTINSLALEDPQHPPLYYVILRFWVEWFGDSIVVVRSLTVLISLLVFPCVYWLCQELFQSPLVGSIAIALLAVSPIHVLFAQEAREYCLWTVTILLSSASLLQAMRLNTKLSWGVYAITLALSLYTFLLSGLVAIGHGIYVAVIEKFKPSQTAIAYLLSSFTGFTIFSPWLLTVASNFHMLQATTGWTSQSLPLPIWVERWLLNLSRIFFDLESNFDKPFVYLVTILLLGYSTYFLGKTTPQHVWLFVLSLIGATVLFLGLPDLISGGQRSVVPRYLFPCYLGVELAVAYLLSTKITASRDSFQRIWQAIAALLLTGGVVSCAIASQAETWWIKDISYKNADIARVINQATQPLLIGYEGCSNNGNIISLSYLLEAKVKLRLVLEPNIPQVPDNFSDVFLFGECSERSRARMEEKGYQLEPVLYNFWKLKKEAK